MSQGSGTRSPTETLVLVLVNPQLPMEAARDPPYLIRDKHQGSPTPVGVQSTSKRGRVLRAKAKTSSQARNVSTGCLYLETSNIATIFAHFKTIHFPSVHACTQFEQLNSEVCSFGCMKMRSEGRHCVYQGSILPNLQQKSGIIPSCLGDN